MNPYPHNHQGIYQPYANALCVSRGIRGAPSIRPQKREPKLEQILETLGIKIKFCTLYVVRWWILWGGSSCKSYLLPAFLLLSSPRPPRASLIPDYLIPANKKFWLLGAKKLTPRQQIVKQEWQETNKNPPPPEIPKHEQKPTLKGGLRSSRDGFQLPNSACGGYTVAL